MDDNSNVSSEDKLKEIGMYMLSSVREGFRENMSDLQEEAYLEGINFGIEKTVASLYDAGIEDKKILELLNKHWLIKMDVATKMLIHEKGNAVIRELSHFLKLQGYSDPDIRSFMIENRVGIKIKGNPELLNLKDNPQKIIEAVKGSQYNK